MQPPQMFTTQRKTTDAFHVCGCNGPSVLLPLHVVMMNNICWEQKESYNRDSSQLAQWQW